MAAVKPITHSTITNSNSRLEPPYKAATMLQPAAAIASNNRMTWRWNISDSRPMGQAKNMAASTGAAMKMAISEISRPIKWAYTGPMALNALLTRAETGAAISARGESLNRVLNGKRSTRSMDGALIRVRARGMSAMVSRIAAMLKGRREAGLEVAISICPLAAAK